MKKLTMVLFARFLLPGFLSIMLQASLADAQSHQLLMYSLVAAPQDQAFHSLQVRQDLSPISASFSLATQTSKSNGSSGSQQDRPTSPSATVFLPRR